MVKGLDIFREHFREYSGQYVLIGGAACDLAMDEAGVPFRVTRDLDIVLCVEALNEAFVRAFWDFIRAGGYETQETAAGHRRFYRFQKPTKPDYPVMLELFSREPDLLALTEGSELTPIPVSDEVSSLSAILLDDDYYRFLCSGTKVKDGVPFVGPEHLIPLKARAWMDLTKRRDEGESVDRKDIKKHRNDVFRLYGIIDPGFAAEIPETIRQDMNAFITRMEAESIDFKQLGFRNARQEGVLETLRRIYCRG
jgi:hypothetical protein